MEYQRNLADARMFNTHRAMDSQLLQTRTDPLHNRQVLRSQLVVRSGFSSLLQDHRQAGIPAPRWSEEEVGEFLLNAC